MTTLSTPSVQRNIVANFIGKFGVVAIGLIFPPIFAKYLGFESYGLIGVFASLTAVLGILDLGLSTTLNREMARLSTESTDESRAQMHDLVATFGMVYWAVGVVAGGLVFLMAPLVVHWVHVKGLPLDTVTDAVRLMGIVFALQWPTGAYNGALLGLQRHSTASAIQVAGMAFRFIGAAIVIIKVSRTVHAFFLWQALGMGLQTLVTWWAVRQSVPPATKRGALRLAILARNWRFSAGMTLISLLSIALTQADKVIVSGILTLEQFGYYTLAWTVGNGLTQLVSPIFVAVFPRFSQLAKDGNDAETSRLYHSSSQLVSVLLLPATVVLAFFTKAVLFAWSGDPVLTEATTWVVLALAIGTALNGLMNVPYALQLGHGWTSLVVWTNVIAVSVMIPLVYLLAKRFGAVGAACSWPILNAGYFLFAIPAMHRRLLSTEMQSWYLIDVGLPLVGAVLPAIVLRLIVSTPSGRLGCLIVACGAGAMSLLGSLLLAPALRRRGVEHLAGLLGKGRTASSDG